jgi:hypothetical protein
MGIVELYKIADNPALPLVRKLMPLLALPLSL